MNLSQTDVASRAEFRCEYCHAPEQVFNFALEIDHIRPRSKERDNTSENLALACRACNGFNSDATMGDDEIEGRNVSLFHPRRDSWEQHFAFDGETGEIMGLTAIGRVTATRLKMNSGFQIRARRHWMSLGLYP